MMLASVPESPKEETEMMRFLEPSGKPYTERGMTALHFSRSISGLRERICGWGGMILCLKQSMLFSTPGMV